MTQVTEKKTTINGNIGLPLGDDGFLSISAEIYEADATSRGVEYCNSWFCADPAEAGNKKAEQALKVLSSDQLSNIRNKIIRGTTDERRIS
jgi:hypothetical protein